MSKYFKLWLMMSLLSTQVSLRSAFGASLFILAKILRIIFFVLFIFLITSNTKAVAGYSLWQMILFYSTFNLVDIIPQFIFRDVYRFRSYIVEGTFDYILSKPISPLFRALFGGSDILDLPTFILSLSLAIVAIFNVGVANISNLVLYFILVVNGLLIALAFYIFTLCLGVLTTEVDHTIMIYRDLTQMGRFPIDIYLEPIKTFLTFIIPIAVMMTFPAKELLGFLSFQLLVISIAISIIFLILSLRLWEYSLNKYQSASS